MFRVRVRSEGLWRNTRNIPVLKKLVKADLQSITTMKRPENIDLAFSRIDLLSGVSKQTNKDRFSVIDELSVEIIINQSLSRILDVGVSSGITSLELMRQLRASSFAGEMFVSDKFARYWVSPHRFSTDIFDADHNLVCTYLGPITGDSEDTWKLPLSKYIFQRAQKRGFDETIGESFLLLHPEVLETIRRGELIFIDFDIFENDQEGAFDFVRCINLLNLGYFSTEQIVSGLNTLHFSLVNGGILQLGRTHLEGSNHVGFYEKTDTGFERIESIGDGPEIDQLIVDLQRTA